MSQSNPTIKLYNGASKIKYNELSYEDQKSLYYQFQRYAVRKEIADQNILLSSIFKSTGDYSACFNAFNSAFIGNNNLIDLLADGELDNLPYLSNSEFESKLLSSRFERQLALICYSLRNNERIPNRVDYPVLISYANMQNRVLNYKRQGYTLGDSIYRAGEETREEFLNKYGCSVKYDYVKLPTGEKQLIDRNVTPRIGYSGTLGVAQSKAYENLINSVVGDLFGKNAKPSKALDVLIQNVCKRHSNDLDFTTNDLITEVIYRYFMPTNKMKEEFKRKLNELDKTVNYKINSSIEGANEKYSQNATFNNLSNLEKFKSESYKNEIYSKALRQMVEKSLKDNVGLKNNLELESKKDIEKGLSQMGEE